MEKLFSSFFMGGYECADHINRSGERINLLHETGHHKMVLQDYLLLYKTGITTVREGICWSLVEKKPYTYDFTEVFNRINAAQVTGMQQIWDLCHFGYPDDLIPTHPQFVSRFVSLCRAFAQFHKKYATQPLLVVPINEISFLSWHSGDVRGTVPFAINSGFDIKYHLCKAAIAGIKALKETDADCTIILVEPLIKIHAPADGCDAEELENRNEAQFQAMDMITGRMCPELGGSENLADVMGLNYYHNCQWELNGDTLGWEQPDTRRAALSTLLLEAHHRYQRPVWLSETGHFGSGRAQWLYKIFGECMKAISLGVNLQGLCLYPVIDRPDWDNLSHYTNSGLWDIVPDNKLRMPCTPYLYALHQCKERYKEFAGTPHQVLI